MKTCEKMDRASFQTTMSTIISGPELTDSDWVCTIYMKGEKNVHICSTLFNNVRYMCCFYVLNISALFIGQICIILR